MGTFHFTLLESFACTYWGQRAELVGEEDSRQLACGRATMETGRSFPVPSIGSGAVILRELSGPATAALSTQIIRDGASQAHS